MISYFHTNLPETTFLFAWKQMKNSFDFDFLVDSSQNTTNNQIRVISSYFWIELIHIFHSSILFKIVLVIFFYTKHTSKILQNNQILLFFLNFSIQAPKVVYSAKIKFYVFFFHWPKMCVRFTLRKFFCDTDFELQRARL